MEKHSIRFPALAAVAMITLTVAPAAGAVVGADVVLTADATTVALTGEIYDDDTGVTLPARVLLDGRVVFTGDFVALDPLMGNQATDNPGWRILGGAPNGDNIGLEPTGALRFWDGSAWVAAVPAGERIRITGKVGSFTVTTTDVTTSGTAGDPITFIDPIVGGGIHAHQDFTLADGSGAAFPGAAVGAYAFEARLVGFTSLRPYTSRQTPSEPFLLAFNHGLAADAFDDAVEALAPAPRAPAVVPLPGAALALQALAAVLTGLGLLAWGHGRRHGRH